MIDIFLILLFSYLIGRLVRPLSVKAYHCSVLLTMWSCAIFLTVGPATNDPFCKVLSYVFFLSGALALLNVMMNTSWSNNPIERSKACQ
jgi:hypothetical protein